MLRPHSNIFRFYKRVCSKHGSVTNCIEVGSSRSTTATFPLHGLPKTKVPHAYLWSGRPVTQTVSTSSNRLENSLRVNTVLLIGHGFDPVPERNAFSYPHSIKLNWQKNLLCSLNKILDRNQTCKLIGFEFKKIAYNKVFCFGCSQY